MSTKFPPRCQGWQEDLPLPGEPLTHQPHIFKGKFNHQDYVYLEVSRSLLLVRGVGIWLGFISIVFAINLIIDLATDFEIKYIQITLIGLVASFIGLWGGVFMIKTDISPPLDLPIRFNRLRKRIYAYNYHYRWWNPFERWYVKPVAYDWSQVRAERWTRRGATMHGATFDWGVDLAIVDLNINEVIDRFLLGRSRGEEYMWAYICAYMQDGPTAVLPPGPPRDHNKFWRFNIAKRLAPKVKWPEAMDIESRTTS